MRSVPDRFLLGQADGIAGLAMNYTSATDVSASTGKSTYVSGLVFHGSIFEERDFDQTVGIMAHEFGHSLGLPDLYDKSFQSNQHQDHADDSAGIGRWGLMGGGTVGWDSVSGPNPFCAWSLEFLGWVGVDNERLIEVHGDRTDLTVTGIHNGGHVYKIPVQSTRDPDAYLLLSHRTRSGPYDAGLPAEGLLIWQVQPRVSDNDDEEDKLLDLICADGLYRDRGFPEGTDVDARTGGDNLDYWAHDAEYTAKRVGNQGDETDPFDGLRFDRFALETNPSSMLPGLNGGSTGGLTIDRMRPRADAMLVDVLQPRWSGPLDEFIEWKSDAFVAGDLTIDTEGALVVYPSVRVLFDPTDRLRAGLDPERIEMHVKGVFRVVPERGADGRIKPGGARFEAAQQGAGWFGIIKHDGATVTLPKGSYELRDAHYGEVVSFDEVRGVGQTTVILEEPVEDAEAELYPFALLPSYPNPFRSETTLRYTLAAASDVRLRVYNTLGQPVRELVAEHVVEGEHETPWNAEDEDGRQVAGGLYLSHLETPDGLSARGKMMYLPSGYASVTGLDTELRDRDADWDALGDAVYGHGVTPFAYARKPSANRAALQLGSNWVRLQVAARYRVDAIRVEDLTHTMGQLATAIDSSRRIDASLASTLQRLQAGVDAAMPLRRVRDRLDRALLDQPAAATVHFYVGEWLESLAMTARAARRLSVPLTQLTDPGADASAARQYRATLSALGVDGKLLDGLDRLAAILDSPSADRQTTRLIGLLQEMTE